MNDNSLKCWGRNDFGQVGSGSTESDVYSPQLVYFGTNRYAISVSISYIRSCAVIDDGSVKCWGKNEYGALGIDNSDTWYISRTPVAVGLGAGISAKEISAGRWHACVILSDNSGVKCWGRNDYGQLGDGTTTQRNSPVTASVLTITSSMYPVYIALSYAHTCVMMNDSSVQCFGFNDSGQLGNGSTTNSLNPVDVNL